jgi:hypothetical protein
MVRKIVTIGKRVAPFGPPCAKAFLHEKASTQIIVGAQESHSPALSTPVALCGPIRLKG